MRITSVLLASSIIAMTASGAIADGSNKAFVWQAGDGSTANIKQLGFGNKMGLYATPFGQGNASSKNNNLIVKQQGARNKIARTLADGPSLQTGKNNSITLNQHFNLNAINTVRQGGKNNKLSVSQNGTENTVFYVKQTGNSHADDKGDITIRQTGDNNWVVEAIQNGAGSYMLLDQKGNLNTVRSAEQRGDDNQMQLWQDAGTSGNVAELYQRGEYNEMYVYQRSDNNEAVVGQVGSNLEITLIQD